MKRHREQRLDEQLARERARRSEKHAQDIGEPSPAREVGLSLDPGKAPVIDMIRPLASALPNIEEEDDANPLHPSDPPLSDERPQAGPGVAFNQSKAARQGTVPPPHQVTEHLVQEIETIKTIEALDTRFVHRKCL